MRFFYRSGSAAVKLWSEGDASFLLTAITAGTKRYRDPYFWNNKVQIGFAVPDAKNPDHNRMRM